MLQISLFVLQKEPEPWTLRIHKIFLCNLLWLELFSQYKKAVEKYLTKTTKIFSHIFKNSNYAIKSHYSSHMKLWRAASTGPVSWLLMNIGLDIDLWPVHSDLNKHSLFWAHAEDKCSRMNEYPLIPQHGMEKCKENEAGSHVRLRKTWFYSTREENTWWNV